MDGLGGLCGRGGGRHDTGPGLDQGGAGGYEAGADDDAGVQLPVTSDVPHRAAVGAATHALGLADELGGPQLGGPGEGAHRHGGAEGVQGVEVLGQLAGDLRDQVHHPAVAVHAQQVLHTAGARTADPGDVVTGQVHEHDVLGDLLGVGAQLQLQAGVALVVHRAVGVQPARPGPSDGADGDPAAAHRVQQRRLRGGAEELEVRGGQVEHVGAGVGMAQHVVGGQRIGAVNGEAARGHHLVDVAVGDVSAHLLHDRLEVGVGDGGHRVQDGGVGATGRCLNGCVGAGGWVVDPVDGGGQRLHAPLQVGGVDRGPHQGRLLGGVVDDQDDAGVVEEVVGAGVGALVHLGQGLEGGQVVEGEGPRLQRQVGVVDLGPGQEA